MKAYLDFSQFHVGGIDKVKLETGILFLALNIRKLAAFHSNNRSF